MTALPKRSNSEAAPEASTTKRSFCGDLLTQTVFLTKKNVLVQGRSTNALLTQLFIGVIFLGMLRLMQLSQEANPNFAADYEELRHPTVTSVELPQRCTPHAWEKGCFSFLAAPNGADALGQYATTIAQQMATDAGFPGKGERLGYELMEDGAAVEGSKRAKKMVQSAKRLTQNQLSCTAQHCAAQEDGDPIPPQTPPQTPYLSLALAYSSTLHF